MKNRFALVLTLFFIFTSPIYSQVKNKRIKGKVIKENKTIKDLDSNKTIINRTKSTTPDVYVQEVSGVVPVVKEVKTAIPAFIGYTEKGSKKPTQISSMQDYMNIFGGPSHDDIGEFVIENDGSITAPFILNTPKYTMYYMLEMFFANGGSDCFIVSVGNYSDDAYSVKNNEMLAGLELLKNEDSPTLLLFPDALSSKNRDESTELYKTALRQSAERKDRFLICDVAEIDNDISKSAERFRTSMGTENLEFGAAYFPNLETTLNYVHAEDQIKVKLKEKAKTMVLRHTDNSIAKDANKTEQSLYHAENGIYKQLYTAINNLIYAKKLVLPPSAAIAGVYAKIDASKGVWKAPANVSLNKVKAPKIDINDNQQSQLTVSSGGKSINAIRTFSGKGVMVWGARTLAGNNNEWKYISVRRLGNMIQESVNNALAQFAYEPNDANTWNMVRQMTENYLTTLWRAGALNGSKPEQAFYVKVGLGQTMTEQDVLGGKMIVEIGIAPIKPAEFIVLKFTQKVRNN